MAEGWSAEESNLYPLQGSSLIGLRVLLAQFSWGGFSQIINLYLSLATGVNTISSSDLSSLFYYYLLTPSPL